MPERDRPLPPVPESKGLPKSRTRLSLVWFIPILAALVGVYVAVTRILAEGPVITLVFQSAEGLEAGKTKVHYNGVDIGTVTGIRLSEDHQRVIIKVQMAPKTEGFLAEDTKFWVVRPRISGANVTGLGTLISGAYIGLEIGDSKVQKRDFVGLETPPVITGEVPGRLFVLKTPDLGSLDNGTPVFFRRLQVGQVSSYALEQDGKSLTVKVFVRAPYDQYVNPNTRFWHASGIDVSLSANGLKVQTQSVLSILVGGIAFETDTTLPLEAPADADSVFTLFGDRAEAFKPAPSNPQTYQLIFNQSVRGLTAGLQADGETVSSTLGEIIERVDLMREGIRILLKLPIAAVDRSGTTHHIALARLIPLQLKRRGVETRMVLAGEATPSRVELPLLKAVARARRWALELISEQVNSVNEIARREHMDKRSVRRLLRVGFLSPRIIEAIAEGHQPPDLTVFSLMRRVDLPLLWNAQEQALGLR